MSILCQIPAWRVLRFARAVRASKEESSDAARQEFGIENGYWVMMVTPPKQPPTIVDGKLPEDDVLVEYM